MVEMNVMLDSLDTRVETEKHSFEDNWMADKSRDRTEAEISILPSVIFSFSFGSVGFPFADGILILFIAISLFTQHPNNRNITL